MSEEREKIASLLKDEGVDDTIITKVMDIDTTGIEKKHSESMDEYMQEEYIDGIVNAVESFNVEDMANMAENLVSITSLQRHFSSSDETVGGPIDVAVITRAEGNLAARILTESILPHPPFFEIENYPHK